MIIVTGLLVANYYYLGTAFKATSTKYRQFTLITFLKIDAIFIFPAFITIGITGWLLAKKIEFSDQSWLRYMYLVFVLILLSWVLGVIVKIRNLRFIKINPHSFRDKLLFHLANIFLLILIFVITVDSTMKTTFLM